MYLKQADDPPYLSVGTAVSAKYKGAFCEAKVSKVVRIVKCKVTYKMGLGIATVSDEHIKGTLRVGHTVLAKHPEKKELVEATIGKIQDCSQYTVVFDDGDITTLRRTALCLKSGRHFNESETLDQLPLTHPEHFGNPVVGGRRGRRNRQLKEDSSEGEAEEENEPDLEGYSSDIGRVVSVETTDKKRGKDNWFPGLVVIPSAQPTVRINVKDEYLIRSFKDGRYYTVPKKEVSEFSREMGEKAESLVLIEAVSKALNFLDKGELPVHWEKNSLFNMQSLDSDSEENYSDSSDEGPNEEKDRFVAQLYKFMDDSGTPLNKSPMIANKDVDLHRLFRVVHKLGGYNRVTNQNKWRSVATRLKLSTNQMTYTQVKNVYKKCLFSYEAFYRTLGVTMLNHTRSTKKNRGRSLIRDKDRATPVSNSPKPDKEEEDKKEEEKSVIEPTKKKAETSSKKDEEKKKFAENSDNSSSSDTTDLSESLPSTSKEVGRPRRVEKIKEKKAVKSTPVVEKAKVETPKKEEEEKQSQLTRSKAQAPKSKDSSTERKKDTKITETPKNPQKPIKKTEEEKKRGRKRINPDEKAATAESTPPETVPGQSINIGDKLKVYYGPTHESKVTYEAKVIEIDKDASGPVYRVHYTGWNTRYDEWINPVRIAENLSASTKAKRLKQGAGATSSATKGGNNAKSVGKRGRGMSITGRSTATEAPRSTTPSSVTSSSSRTKSPATPATRSTSRMTRQDYGRKTRRSSAQTDISNHSDQSDSEISESESELTRTRSGTRSEEVELKTYKKKAPKTPTKTKDDADKEEDNDNKQPKRLRKVLKKSPEKSADDSDEDTSTNPPKGRDFDLNQIRSELKGFSKAVKTPSIESNEKETLSSSDDSTGTQNPSKLEPNEDKLEVKPMELEKSPSSEDIYEFKEPEPFEFESRPKMSDDKTCKKRIPRIFEDLEKSPKRTKPVKSPTKLDKTSPDLDKKFRKTPVKKCEEFEPEDKKEDLFDKLVESPSFNLVKAKEKATASATNQPSTSAESSKAKAAKNLDALDLFRDFNEPVDESSRDIDLSDNDTQSQSIFSRNDELFTSTFCKQGMNTLEAAFSSKSDENKKENDEFDSIRESITRAIQRTPSSDEYDRLSDDDLLITPSLSSYQPKKRDVEQTTASKIPKLETDSGSKVLENKEETTTTTKSPILNISPALQETDSKLLQSICAQPVPATSAKLDETKDLNLKTGTKIADSILQKFSSIKKEEVEEEVKKEIDNEPDLGVKPLKTIIKPAELKVKPSEIVESKKSVVPTAVTATLAPIRCDLNIDNKKKRKVVSKAYIEETDSDSSDSEQLVIARSDEDSQTLDKPDLKESDSNLSAIQNATTDDSQTEGQQQTRNFKFDKVEEKPSETQKEQEQPAETAEADVKEEEPADSQLHSLLLCEETIPRSPAPVSEGSNATENRPKANKSVLEMPFASAPGSSNNKNMLLNSDHKPVNKPPQPPPLVMPVANNNNNNRDNQEASTVLDNTPPTTPESSISNLSPRRDGEDLSPKSVENESCKSNDAEPEFSRKRRNSSVNKPPHYSEDDSQMTNEATSVKKAREEPVPAACRKRRKSARTEDTPVKRGRKPLNRSRHNSDSDDTSEHSLSGPTSTTNLLGAYSDRTSKSPRPSKYNFFVEFDPSLNSGQRIAVLQQKLSELRKTYAEVKSELAAVERRRKKIRRREREALKASKQEMVCG